MLLICRDESSSEMFLCYKVLELVDKVLTAICCILLLDIAVVWYFDGCSFRESLSISLSLRNTFYAGSSDLTVGLDCEASAALKAVNSLS